MLNKTQETNTYRKEKSKLKAFMISNLYYEISFQKLLHAKSVSCKLVPINYTIYWGINSSQFINFVYRFGIPSLNNLSGDQDDVMMVKEEILQAETIAEVIFQIVI